MKVWEIWEKIGLKREMKQNNNDEKKNWKRKTTDFKRREESAEQNLQGKTPWGG